ncbi:hypothetical protein LZG04_30280 [Saccharothrix sp. S26]|uniref:hypothetical protein n=1 Tax=Saccharothrix sp. S26 TaxID=2907215 RepID=UPI001F15D938|nr:hypothetical protein [Saccharothrix sp. S26]MCE6999059.1 hypothetical protein [Saccharothrix sp. S26]
MLRLLPLVLLLAACTTPAAVPTDAPRPEPPRWSKLTSDLPADFDVIDLAGWDQGLVVTGNPVDPQVRFSADGQRWTEARLNGITGFAYGGATAGHGAAGYVLGTSERAAAVWRSEDGANWQRIELPDAALDQYRSIAAGPRGVVVVGLGEGRRREGGVTVYSDLQLWFAEDGRSFVPKVRVPADVSTGATPRVTAVADGFLLDVDGSIAGRTLLYFSPDGLDWQPIGDGMPATIEKVVGRSGPVTAMLARTARGDEASSEAWRRDEDGQWREGTLDPGKLPDAGVSPNGHQVFTGIRQWGSGFLGFGYSAGTEGTVGVVWTSADGLAWDRMPVRDNGFDAVRSIYGFATVGDQAFLLGGAPQSTDPAPVFWRANAVRTSEPEPVAVPTTTPGGPVTEVVDYVPFRNPPTSSDRGECFTPSESTTRTDAWRCLGGDPCFSAADHPGQVECPRSTGESVLLQLTGPLPERHPSPPGPDVAWRLRLAGGAVCDPFHGAGPEPLEGLALAMVCGDGTMVWGNPDTSTGTWTVRTSADEYGPLTTSPVVTAYR